MSLRESGRIFRILRQDTQKVIEEVFIEFKARRKLPQDRSELRPKAQRTRRYKVGKGCFDVLEPQHVRDVAGALD
ncbi:hypothetical protein FHT77_004234 [Rhizobium sp. BK181]|nr:hypothetical protein [Rhizobium sp. BK181]